MTETRNTPEHSIEELERQYKAALSRRLDAEQAERNARERLKSARRAKLLAEVQASGIEIGVTPLQLFRRRYGGNEEPAPNGPYFIIGVDDGYGEPRLAFSRAKKDGTAGKAKAVVSWDRYEVAR